MTGAVFELGLKAVVEEEAFRESFFDGRKRGNWTTGCQAETTARGRGIARRSHWVRHRLIQIGEHLDLDPVFTDVGSFKHCVLVDLLLNREMVALDVTCG